MRLCQTLHFHSNFDDLFTFTFLLFTTVLSYVQDDSYMYLCQILHFHSNIGDLFTFIFFNFLQLYCPNEISPTGNSGCLPWGKPAVIVALPNLQCMLGVLVFP